MYDRKVGKIRFLGNNRHGIITLISKEKIIVNEVRGLDSPYTQIVLKEFDNHEMIIEPKEKWTSFFNQKQLREFLQDARILKEFLQKRQVKIRLYNRIFNRKEYAIQPYIDWLNCILYDLNEVVIEKEDENGPTISIVEKGTDIPPFKRYGCSVKKKSPR